MSEPLTPVLFRVDAGEVTAVFPTDPSDNSGSFMGCYSHVGQHAACSFGWYHRTRAATDAESAPLKAELEAAPYGYRLQVYKRLSPKLREAYNAALRDAR